MLKAINIKWDTDGDMEVLNELPTEIIIPDNLEAMYKINREHALEKISDLLSEQTGFCHYGFKIKCNEITKESVRDDLMIFFNSKMISGDAPDIGAIFSVKNNGIDLSCIGGKHIRVTIDVVD